MQRRSRELAHRLGIKNMTDEEVVIMADAVSERVGDDPKEVLADMKLIDSLLTIQSARLFITSFHKRGRRSNSQNAFYDAMSNTIERHLRDHGKLPVKEPKPVTGTKGMYVYHLPGSANQKHTELNLQSAIEISSVYGFSEKDVLKLSKKPSPFTMVRKGWNLTKL